MVNRGWVLAANLAADLSAWCRLLGLYDQEDLKDAEPDTLRRLWALPARLVRHARVYVLKISRTWPWTHAFLTCWQAAMRPCPHPPDQPPPSLRPGRRASPARSEPVDTC